MPPIRPAAQQLVGPVLTPTLVDTGTESVAGLATLAGGAQAGSGSAAAPAYSYSSATNYGWYYDIANASLAGAAGGVETVQITNVGGTSPTLLVGPKSSAGVAFVATAGQLGIVTGLGGTVQISVYSIFLNVLYGNNGGSASAGTVYTIYGASGLFHLAMGATEALQVALDAAFSSTPFASFGGGSPVSGNAFTIRGQTSDASGYALRIEDHSGTVQATIRNTGVFFTNNAFVANSNGSAANPPVVVGTTNNSGIYSDGSNLRLSSNNANVASWNAAGQLSGLKGATASKTASYTVLATDSFTTFDNTGAGAQVTFTLPAATAGLEYLFVNTGAGATFAKVQAVGTDKIAQNGVLGAAAGNLVSTTIWSVINIQCVTAGTWVVIQGAWTLT